MKISAPKILVIMGAALLLGVATHYFFNQPRPKISPPMAATNEKESWTCPMHPQIHLDHPGSCPICGMTLVRESTRGAPSNGGERPEGHGAFTLSEANQKMIGVKFGVVEHKQIFKSIDVAGRVAFDPELYTAQTEFVEAVKQMENVRNSPLPDVKHSAKSMVESAKLRLKILGLSDKQILILSSGGGSKAGSLLLPNPGEDVWVYAEVYEMDLPLIQPGLSARISGLSLPHPLEGTVASVDRVINPASRTAKVRIKVPSAKSQLRPEAYVDVSIQTPLGEQNVVPFGAVLDTGKESWIFVLKENDRIEPRLVTVKFRAGDEIALESGAEPGEKIVTSSNFLIDSESRLRSVFDENTPQKAGGHDHQGH